MGLPALKVESSVMSIHASPMPFQNPVSGLVMPLIDGPPCISYLVSPPIFQIVFKSAFPISRPFCALTSGKPFTVYVTDEISKRQVYTFKNNHLKTL